MAVEINSIEYSGWVLGKVNQKHNLTIDDVFDAIEGYVKADWVDDVYEGEARRRLFVTGPARKGRTSLRIILYPIDEEAGEFRLGSAF